MNLSEYLASPGALTVGELRKRSGVPSDAQIRQWQHGYANRRPGPTHCVAIERATSGAVTRRDLRPDDWHLIWPELATAPPAADSGAAPETAIAAG
ncbi:helix-turn-helix domain-containing protein [Acidovorax sp. sif1233]|uniref:transcriptional regulator n=1 Tax=Acidovorax sp. sif1233 TaxID=2854792 RepID=UPI001C479284|nr:YdaS family helix-turn-helix protein [Acidovorax sp. sif1233]MBV7457340.1 helix-turn-helix domain-containing protein [Acidovorax sp. sif1233]